MFFFCFFRGGVKVSVCIIVGLVVIEAPFLSLRTLGICCLVLIAGGVSIMSRLLCLKIVALAVSVSDLSLFSLVDIHATVVFAATRVLDFRGKACLSESNTLQKVVVVPQILSLSLFPHCVAMLVGLRRPNLTPLVSQSPHQQRCKKLQICVSLRHCTLMARKQPKFGIRKKSSEGSRLHALAVSLDTTLL